MSYYETVFIARPDVTAAQVEGLADHFAGILASQGGEVRVREFWGLRNLAYRIKKNRKGHYVFFGIEAPAAAIQELERTLRLHEDVLRHLALRVDELEDGPSIMLRKRDDRELPGGREGRDGAPREREGRRDDRLRPRMAEMSEGEMA
ncbi:MAG TPA: 30S ribosomal protein S6 [Dongiaceae bacterium]|jgi:small subunit ribosomal protein S6|nr:30S ribosomal protein S6 [Dongiaceae bacterium]